VNLKSFEYFRALAILFIIANHCYGLSGDWQPATVFGKFVVNFFTIGGATYFTFISGFLFHSVSYREFKYTDFMIKRIKKVACPYLLLSIIPIFVLVFVLRTGPYPEYFFLPAKGLFYQYIRPFVLYLVTGRTFWAYWYIPYIMVVYALSPLFMIYIKWSFRSRLVVVLFFFCISTLIHRPPGMISIFQAVIYFIPVYLLGIMASMHKDEVYLFLKGKEIYLLLAALSLSLIQVIFYDNFLIFFKKPFEFNVIDISIIQKSIMCLFLMVWLHRFEYRQISFLRRTAEASFALYFIHPILLTLFKHFSQISYDHKYKIASGIFDTLYHPLGLFIYFFIILSVSYMIALLLRRVFGSYSKLVIGW
jgi:probable poly-beta-1,6-N-acetyl-D-glucosamine export protein